MLGTTLKIQRAAGPDSVVPSPKQLGTLSGPKISPERQQVPTRPTCPEQAKLAMSGSWSVGPETRSLSPTRGRELFSPWERDLRRPPHPANQVKRISTPHAPS